MKAAAKRSQIADPDERAVAEIIDELWTERPAHVKNYELELGEDHTGDPAIWIYLKVSKDNNPSRQKVVSLRKFSDTVQQKVIDKRLHRWPYVRIQEVR